jgi:flagellar basal body-associated protein FliL
VNKKIAIIATCLVAVLGLGLVGFETYGTANKGAGAASEEKPKLAYVEVREMTLRLADLNAEHYIKLDPVLAVRMKAEEETASKLALVRDRIVTVVTARSSTELSSPAGQRKLKEDLLTELHKDLQDVLVDIYFSDYLVE